MDINEKLRRLTPEQAKQLGAHLNSVYIEAEKTKRQKETTVSSKKKSSTKEMAENHKRP